MPEPENRLHLSSELLNTAGHELNHAITAMELGVPVISISVIPNGNSLGRTAFSGLPRTQNALTVRSGMNGLFPRSEPLMPRA